MIDLPAERGAVIARALSIRVCFDGDAAGRAATGKALAICADEPTLRAQAATLPDGHDPDSYLRAYGIEAFCALVGCAPPPPYDAERARYERWWDARELDYARREHTALWREEGLAMVVRERERRAEEVRRAEMAHALRERLSAGGCGDVLTRASRYLATMDAGPKGLVRAAFKLAQGWALDDDATFTLLRDEYVPRYHRPVPDGELRGVVRRAQRAPCRDRGWLLKDRQRP